MTQQTQKPNGRAVKLLVINPNSSVSMTQGLDQIIHDLGYSESTQVTTYTAPRGPIGINNEDDAQESAEICVKSLGNTVSSFDGFLVACYSINPLVFMLKPLLPIEKRHTSPITGIFEASISTALALLPPPVRDGAGRRYEKFGIVTTGKYWEKVLTDGVLDYLGCQDMAGCKRFKGVQTTGLSASELHTSPPEEVRSKMMDATKRLVKDGDVSVICLGCAGMAGMDEMVREACVEELGVERATGIQIVDGVKAGIAILDGLVRGASEM